LARHAPVRPRPASRRAAPLLLLILTLLLAVTAPAPAGAAPRPAPTATATPAAPTATPATPTATAAPPRVLPLLLDQAAAQPDKTFRVIVGRAGSGTAADKYVASMGYRKLRNVAGFGFVAEVPGRGIAGLGTQTAVRWVTVDAPVLSTAAPVAESGPTTPVDANRLATVYPQTLDAPQLWNDGVTGQGVGIAVIDTGVDDALADFKTAGGASRVVKVKTNAAASAVADGHGHGTHVAGIALGNSWAQDAASLTRGQYLGVAPGATLVSVRVSDDLGQTYVSDVIDGIEWVIANRATHNIRVLNLSLLSSVAESATTSYLAAAVERAWFNGILVVVAAGNLGPDTAQYAPANDPFVVTVGASDDKGSTTRSDDGMAPWSSHGTTQDGYAKPDVVAPGRYVRSTLASTGGVLGTLFPERVAAPGYLWMSGTSAAAPMVAGAAALAFEKHPEWTNDAVKWLLTGTATRLGGNTPLPGQGAGLVDASRLVNYTGTPGVANDGLPVSVQLTGPDGATTYTTSSWTTSSWTTSSWTTSSWTTSSWTTSSWTSSSWTSSSWTYAPVQ
jgi:serine protease AprX